MQLRINSSCVVSIDASPSSIGKCLPLAGHPGESSRWGNLCGELVPRHAEVPTCGGPDMRKPSMDICNELTIRNWNSPERVRPCRNLIKTEMPVMSPGDSVIYHFREILFLSLFPVRWPQTLPS
jgi:hypothetical protein